MEFALADFVDYTQVAHRLHKDAFFNVRLENWMIAPIKVIGDPPPEIASFSCEPTTATVGETVTLRWQTINTEGIKIEIVPKIGEVAPTGHGEITAEKTATWTLRLSALGMNDVTRPARVIVQSLPGTVTEPIAQVRSTSGGWRRGKGFSRRELKACGINGRGTTHALVRVDTRRRSSHQTNIKTLRSLTDV